MVRGTRRRRHCGQSLPTVNIERSKEIWRELWLLRDLMFLAVNRARLRVITGDREGVSQKGTEITKIRKSLFVVLEVTTGSRARRLKF